MTVFLSFLCIIMKIVTNDIDIDIDSIDWKNMITLLQPSIIAQQLFDE